MAISTPVKERKYRKGVLHKYSSKLSPRQFDCLNLLKDGLQTKEIAFRLGITESTVETHLDILYHKLRVHNRIGAIVEGHKRGLIEI